MGGQVFRFDIYNGEAGADFIKGQRIADLGGDDETNHRRFVYGPDVTEAIGKGSRILLLPLVQVIAQIRFL